MIATANHATEPRPPDWHAAFLAMVPAIRQHARVTFRKLDAESREELVQEVVANCFVAFRRLVELGKQDLAYPTVLARYAIAQVYEGRRVGTKLNVRDISSSYCQRAKGISVGRLDHFDTKRGDWIEILVEDRRATPADVAAWRIDFSDWLRSLTDRQRRLAETLATGESTGAAARMFHVSAGRISQLRLELKAAWQNFQGELATA